MAKILAIKLRAIGDTVIWTAALQTLRGQRPDAEIHTLTYVSNAAVLENHPAVDAQHFLQGHGRLELLTQLWTLRRQRFEWLLGFHATTSLCRWAWLVGAKQNALHHHSRNETPRGSVSIPHAGELEDAIWRDHRVLEAVGMGGTKPAPTLIQMTPAESAAAESLMSAQISASGGNPRLPRYLFLPGASHHLRRYPKDQWLPLATRLKNEGRFQPVVIVDEALSSQLDLRADCARLGLPLLDRAAGLRQFVALISRGQKALGNDSGPGHIAVALGLKTSFVFGPGCVGDWHPYDKSDHPLYRIHVPCRAEGPRDSETFQYCTVAQCSHHRCLRELHIESL